MYKDEVRKKVFEVWKDKILEDALKEGLADMKSIDWLHRTSAEAAYQIGFREGRNEGYSEAVKDVEMEKNNDHQD